MNQQEKQKRWYIIHTYSGHENKVKVNLEKRVDYMNLGHKIFKVEVPQKSVTRVKDGKRQDKEEKIFPGYVLVEMIMDDDSWYVVRHTPGVTKFVGGELKENLYPQKIRKSTKFSVKQWLCLQKLNSILKLTIKSTLSADHLLILSEMSWKSILRRKNFVQWFQYSVGILPWNWNIIKYKNRNKRKVKKWQKKLWL